MRDDERERAETRRDERVPEHGRREARPDEEIADHSEEEAEEDQGDALDITIVLDHPDALDHASEGGEREQSQRERPIGGPKELEHTTATPKYTAFAARDSGRILSALPPTESPKYASQTIPASRAIPISTRAVSAGDMNGA